MIETKVPKDIRAYDIRIAGPFTVRQAALLTVAFMADMALCSLVLDPLQVPSEIRKYAVILLDLPILMFIAKPMGMKMEQYLAAVIRSNYLAPLRRRAENRIVQRKPCVYTKKELKVEKKMLKKAMPEHPEYRAFR